MPMADFIQLPTTQFSCQGYSVEALKNLRRTQQTPSIEVKQNGTLNLGLIRNSSNVLNQTFESNDNYNVPKVPMQDRILKSSQTATRNQSNPMTKNKTPIVIQKQQRVSQTRNVQQRKQVKVESPVKKAAVRNSTPGLTGPDRQVQKMWFKQKQSPKTKESVITKQKLLNSQKISPHNSDIDLVQLMSPTTHDLLVHSTNIFGAAIKAMTDLQPDKKVTDQSTVSDALKNSKSRQNEQQISQGLTSTIGRNTVQSQTRTYASSNTVLELQETQKEKILSNPTSTDTLINAATQHNPDGMNARMHNKQGEYIQEKNNRIFSGNSLNQGQISRELRRIQMMKPDMQQKSRAKKGKLRNTKYNSTSQKNIDNFLKTQDSDDSDYSYYNFKNGAQRPQRNNQNLPQQIFRSQYNKEKLGDSQYCFNLVVAGGLNNFSTNTSNNAPTANMMIEDYQGRKQNSKDGQKGPKQQLFGHRIPQKPNYLKELKGKANNRNRSQETPRFKATKTDTKTSVVMSKVPANFKKFNDYSPSRNIMVQTSGDRFQSPRSPISPTFFNESKRGSNVSTELNSPLSYQGKFSKRESKREPQPAEEMVMIPFSLVAEELDEQKSEIEAPEDSRIKKILQNLKNKRNKNRVQTNQGRRNIADLTLGLSNLGNQQQPPTVQEPMYQSDDYKTDQRSPDFNNIEMKKARRTVFDVIGPDSTRNSLGNYQAMDSCGRQRLNSQQSTVRNHFQQSFTTGESEKGVNFDLEFNSKTTDQINTNGVNQQRDIRYQQKARAALLLHQHHTSFKSKGNSFAFDLNRNNLRSSVHSNRNSVPIQQISIDRQAGYKTRQTTPLRLHRGPDLINQAMGQSSIIKIEGAIQSNGMIPFTDLGQLKPQRVVVTKKNY